ncbi:MAG: amidohydrolase family protein [Clostridiales bacterium]|nr:amidohydrolase family protein [Clostridiales bacterium]
MNLLIQNCMIIDGTGAPAYAGSVGFEQGRIRVFRGGELPTARETIDARGLTLLPGLIDAHSHGDLTLVSPFAARSKLGQGITTQIAGQCGVSLFPAGGKGAGLFSRFVSGIAPYPDLPDDLSRLSSASGFFGWLESLHQPIATKCFVGHGTLRLWAMGYENRKPDAGELRRMQDMLRRCIREGALGLSTGQVYAPSCYADNEEILALLRVVHEEDGVYANHPRNEGDQVAKARLETIRLALEADVPLCVSHLKAAGKRNWGKPRGMLEQLERAAEQGLRAMVDCYPYTAGCTSLNVSIPPRYFTRGLGGLIEALENSAERAIIREEMSRPSNYDNYVLNSGGFSGVYVSSCPFDHSAEGMFVSEYAERRGMTPFDAFCDILVRNKGLGLGIYFHMSEDDVVEILTHPLCVLGTDGLIGRPGENPHPRAFGSTGRAYRLLVREKKLLSPEAAIHKMSGQAAEFLGLHHKGRILDGMDADALLVDLDTFCDTATYQNGATPCEGIERIFIQGRQAFLPSEQDSASFRFPGE